MNEKNVSGALFEQQADGGLTRNQIEFLLKQFSEEEELMPVMVEGDNSYAFGFIREEAANELSYDLKMLSDAFRPYLIDEDSALAKNQASADDTYLLLPCLGMLFCLYRPMGKASSASDLRSVQAVSSPEAFKGSAEVIGATVFCKASFVEDDTEYWSKGQTYQVLGKNSLGLQIESNYGEGLIYPEDFDEFFSFVAPGGH